MVLFISVDVGRNGFLGDEERLRKEWRVARAESVKMSGVNKKSAASSEMMKGDGLMEWKDTVPILSTGSDN